MPYAQDCTWSVDGVRRIMRCPNRRAGGPGRRVLYPPPRLDPRRCAEPPTCRSCRSFPDPHHSPALNAPLCPTCTPPRSLVESSSSPILSPRSAAGSSVLCLPEFINGVGGIGGEAIIMITRGVPGSPPHPASCCCSYGCSFCGSCRSSSFHPASWAPLLRLFVATAFGRVRTRVVVVYVVRRVTPLTVALVRVSPISPNGLPIGVASPFIIMRASTYCRRVISPLDGGRSDVWGRLLDAIDPVLEYEVREPE